ncbi:MAG: Hsp20/alpha crystallin family protein [Methanobacterium sp.]|jgi:HSP20 family protein
MEKKEIKTKKELKMEKSGEKEIKEVPVETGVSTMEKRLEKGRTTAQKIFEDMISTFREKQREFEKVMSEYGVPTAKPAMDVIETDNDIIVKTDLPGVKKEDIVIDLTEDTLEVMAKFEEESTVEGENFIKKERKYGEAKRVVSIPEQIKIDEASAKFADGVLTVTIPKEEKKRHHLKLE